MKGGEGLYVRPRYTTVLGDMPVGRKTERGAHVHLENPLIKKYAPTKAKSMYGKVGGDCMFAP
jgi:hypothetical protein